MKWWLRIWHKIKKLFLRLLGVIVIEKLIGPNDIAREIDSDTVYLVRSDAYNIGIVFKDGSFNSFPIDKPGNWDNYQKIAMAVSDPFMQRKDKATSRLDS